MKTTVIENWCVEHQRFDPCSVCAKEAYNRMCEKDAQEYTESHIRVAKWVVGIGAMAIVFALYYVATIIWEVFHG
jgi:hypothetical protein